MVSKNPWQPDPENGDSLDRNHELRLARTLGEYVDRFAAGEITDFREFLSEHPDVAPELAMELQALDDLRSIIEERDTLVTFGDFRLLREAGRGGMGIVYEAWQISLDRRIALKVLPAGLLADPKAVTRFHREARVAANLHHENIVGVHTMGVEGGTPYFAMEFADGETLQQILRRLQFRRCSQQSGPSDETMRETLFCLTRLMTGEGSRAALPGSDSLTVDLDPSSLMASAVSGNSNQPQVSSRATLEELTQEYCLSVAEAFAGAADGLQHAHANGVVHRDLKPSNLILDTERRLRILDFGLAWVEGQTNLTQSRERLGTPLYMSPEQARAGPFPLGPCTDIYSLGATLYEMLVWRPPFDGRDHQETLFRIEHYDPVPLRRLNHRIPKDLETIVLKCLRKIPRERYGTAEAFAQDLRRFVRGDPVEARPQSKYEQLARRAWRSRRRIGEVAGAVTLLLLVVILLAGYSAEQRKKRWQVYEEKVRGAVVKMLRKEMLTPGESFGRVKAEKVPLSVKRGQLYQNANFGGSDNVFGGASDAFGLVPATAGPLLADVGQDPVAEAVAQLEDAVKLFPGEPIAYYHLARALLSQGKRGQAKEELGTALKLDRSFVPALSLWASILRKERDPQADQASALLGRFSSVSGRNWAKDWLDAHEALLKQDWNAAAAAYDRLDTSEILGKEGEHYLGLQIEALMGRGMARLKAGDLDKALEDLGASKWYCRQRPEAIEPTLFLGKVQYLKENQRTAEATFEDLYKKSKDGGSANAGSPSASDVAGAIAAAYRELGDYLKALDWAKKMKAGPAQLEMEAELFSHLDKLEEAFLVASAAVERSPRDVGAHLILGNVLMARGSLTEAKESYNQAAELDPKDARPLLALGVCLEAEKKLPEAIEKFEQAIKLYPSLGQAHYNLGRVLSQQGKIDEGIESFRTAIEANPNHALARNNLGVLLDRQGRLDEAMEEYQRAANLAPVLGIAHYNLGWAYHRQRRFSDAATEYQEAVRFGLNDDPVVHNNLGACLQMVGKVDEAIKAYTTSIRQGPKNFLVRYNLGTAYYRQNNLPAAIKAYREALRLEQGWVEIHSSLGLALGEAGRVAEAIQEDQAALQLDPKCAWAHNNLTGLFLNEKLPIPAGRTLEEAIIRLEDARLLVYARPSVSNLLERYREAFYPHLASYASVDAVLDGPEVLLPEGATWRYFRGRSEPSKELDWAQPSFNDADWDSGPSPFGYPEKVDVKTNLYDMQGNYTTVYLRHRFEVSDPSVIQEIFLSLRADDGCVVYLNGAEVGRWVAGIEGTRIPYDAVASGREEEQWAAAKMRLDESYLRAGENVLSLQGINVSKEDGDFCLDPVLKFLPVYDARRDRKALESFRAAGAGPEAQPKLAYFEGRVLQRSGSYNEAEEKYQAVLALDGGRPEPFLRLAECLRETGNADGAEEVLRGALKSGLQKFDQLWDGWLRLSFVDLKLGAAETLAALPLVEDGLGDGLQGRPADIRWLLEELTQHKTLRINCGGTECRESEGNSWSQDRFYSGGLPMTLWELDRKRAERKKASPYQTERYYWEAGPFLPGYSIPLPEGNYRVTLHFTEGYFTERNKRRFDVLLEGVPVLKDYEPIQAGFGVPEKHSFETRVIDGSLNIDFYRRIQNPKISGIEVESR